MTVEAHTRLSVALADRYRIERELAAIDPQGSSASVAANVLAFYRGRFVDAAEAARRLPASGFMAMLIAWCEAMAGNDVATLSALDEVPEGEGGNPRAMAGLLRAAIEGRIDDVAAAGNHLAPMATNDITGALFLSDIYGKVGDRANTLRWLRHAVEMGCFMPDFLFRYNPFFANLRDDPEFLSIVERARVGAARVRATIDRQLEEIR